KEEDMYRYYVLALIVIITDQISKWFIVKEMEQSESIVVIKNFFSITSHRNKGAAWGILENQMIFFYIITLVVVIGIIYYMQKYAKENALLAMSLGLLLGGALGNFIDRLFRNEVVDFLDFKIINYNYPIFNIADSALFIGVVILIIYVIIVERKNNMMKNLEKVTKQEIGMRLDKFLTLKNPKNSRQEIQSWIKNGNVLVNGFVKKANYKVTNYDEIVWNIPQEVKRNIEPENIP